MKDIPRLSELAHLYGTGKAEAQRQRYSRLANDLENRQEDFISSERQSIRYFSAPGRTELCGNHTDHNNGRVLAAAIDLDIIAAVRPRDDGCVRIHSAGYSMIELDVSDLAIRKAESGTSAALIRGIAYGISNAFPGAKIRGFDASLHSNVLPGSGLSSSAAFEVLIAAIFSDICGLPLTPAQAARLGQISENDYFGKPCGLMDQMASACGSVAKIDFIDPMAAEVEILEFDLNASGYSLAIVSTGGSHSDLTNEYASIPSEMRSVAACLGRDTLGNVSADELVKKAGSLRSRCGDRAFLRALHFAHENERVDAMAQAIREKNLDLLLSIARDSGDSSWKYLQNMHVPTSPRKQGLEIALALTREYLGKAGACRVHGGGFAGAIQAYIPDDRMEGYRSYMESVFGPNSVIPLSIRPWGVARIDSI